MVENSAQNDGWAVPIGRGPVSRAMLHLRTQELALLAGYAAPYVHQSHYEQAKQELTGESDLDRQNAMLDRLPARETWRFPAAPVAL